MGIAMFGLGWTEVLVIMGGLLCFMVLPVALIVYGVIAANKEWRVVHEGHQIVLQNKILSEKLYVDGQVVDRSSWTLTTVLRGRLELGDGRAAVVEGRIGQGFLGLSIKGRIYVDGRLVGGDPE
jgi:hypothetical protein